MKLLQNMLIAIIRLYQIIVSPHIGKCCRFHPSCSNYSITAIKTHGAIKGLWLSIKRICRCRPFGASGYDPVPEPGK